MNPILAPGAWGVFLLFLIPVGGGIPAGVLLARNRAIGWPMMLFLYFVSDVVLAFTFEPLLKLLMAAGRRFAFAARLSAVVRKMVDHSTSSYGSAGGPLALILIAFGVDPMTGRAAAAAAGHGFFSGWTMAITGDMLFFTVIMVSTLSLNSVLGDGTKTTAIILALMFFLPPLIRRIKARRSTSAS